MGFTNPIDDMGPHNPVTHPALLDKLTADFVASGYDVKQLIRWICKSEPYQLSSRFSETNIVDNPEIGEIPLFSRMYVKPMTVEQLYDSLMVATQLDENRGNRWNESGVERREQWLQQFVVAYDTEENNETTTFDGTLPQALMMMNGDLVQGSAECRRRHVSQTRRYQPRQRDRQDPQALSRGPLPLSDSKRTRCLPQTVARANGHPWRQPQAGSIRSSAGSLLGLPELQRVHPGALNNLDSWNPSRRIAVERPARLQCRSQWWYQSLVASWLSADLLSKQSKRITSASDDDRRI